MDARVLYRRRRRIAMGGTFLVAVSLAMQMGLEGEAAAGMLGTTAPVACLGAALGGWSMRPAAALAMGAAALAVMMTLGLSQSSSDYARELLLFAIPFSAAAGIVTGHVRRWPGVAAGGFALVLAALAFGVGMTTAPVPFAVANLAILVSLPTVPIAPDSNLRSPTKS